MLKALLIAGISVAQEHILKQISFLTLSAKPELVQLASKKSPEKICLLLTRRLTNLPRLSKQTQQTILMTFYTGNVLIIQFWLPKHHVLV